METSEQHEILLVERLIDRSRRDRIKALIQTKRGREKLIQRLAHNIDFNHKLLQKLSPSQQNPRETLKLLKKNGAPDTCYVISEETSIDGKQLNLKEVLEIVIGSGMGTIISCIPGRLAYFESEEEGDKFIIKRGD